MIDNSAKSIGVSAKFIPEDAKSIEVCAKSIRPESCPRHTHDLSTRKHRRGARSCENRVRINLDRLCILLNTLRTNPNRLCRIIDQL